MRLPSCIARFILFMGLTSAFASDAVAKRIIPKTQGPHVPQRPQSPEDLLSIAVAPLSQCKLQGGPAFREFTKAHDTWAERNIRGEDPGPEPRLEQFSSPLAHCYQQARREALANYKTFLDNYPNYDRLDRVLFNQAFMLMQSGQAEAGVARFRELIRRYPNSPYRADAHVQLGQHFFEATLLREAKAEFENALATSRHDPKVHVFALYRLACVDIKASDYPAGIDRLMRVVAESTSKGGAVLKSQALHALVVPLVQVRAIVEGADYFERTTSQELSRQFIAQLADAARAAGKCDAAIENYQKLVIDDPDGSNVPGYERAVGECHHALGHPGLAEAQWHAVVQRYRPGSEWSQRHASDAPALAQAYEVVESALQSLLNDVLARARRTRRAGEYRRAAALQRDYLDMFGDRPNALTVRFRRAEVLWALREYESAAAEYERIVDYARASEHAREAAVNAALCYQMLADAERDQAARGPASDGDRIDEMAPKPPLAADARRHSDDTPEAAALRGALDRRNTPAGRAARSNASGTDVNPRGAAQLQPPSP